MLCKLDLGCSGCRCMTHRMFLLSWGYLKIVAAILLSPLTNEPIYRTDILNDYIGILTFAVLLPLIIVDVVFHSILVVGAIKANVKQLIAYRRYVKTLWALTIVLTFIYILMEVFDLGRYYRRYEFYPLATFIWWYLTLVIQSFIVLIVNRYINNITGNTDLGNNKRDYTTEYTFKIEISGTKKVIPKEGNEEEKEDTTYYSEDIETNYEKAALVKHQVLK